MGEDQSIKSLKLGTGWTRIAVIGEPSVILTVRGYAPILTVRQERNDLEYILYISAKSLSDPLELLRKQNGDKFTGLDIELRKTTSERSAPYEVRDATDTKKNA